MIDFKRAVMEFAHTQTDLRTTDQRLAQQFDVQIAGILNTGSKDNTPAPEVELDAENSTGPFIGVASRSKRDSIITYYGIDNHSGWIFTPLYR